MAFSEGACGKGRHWAFGRIYTLAFAGCTRFRKGSNQLMARYTSTRLNVPMRVTKTCCDGNVEDIVAAFSKE